MLITWEPTPARNRVNGIISLLSRADWAASAHATALKSAVARLTDDPDDGVRMLAAPALPLLYPDDAELRDELTRRLRQETSPPVRGQLLAVAFTALDARPDHIDSLLSQLAGDASWPMLSAGPEPARTEDHPDPASARDLTGPQGLHAEAPAVADDNVIQHLLWLSVACEQPFATGLLQTWLRAPADNPARAGRATVFLRPWLNGADKGVTDAQAERAFQLLALPIPQAASTWGAAAAAGGPAGQADGAAARLKAAVRAAEAVGRELHFASGAVVAGNGAGIPAPAFFADHAFPVLEALTAVPHPAVVERIVQALSHIAGHDPRRAFLAIANAATAGHGYEWERQGADLIVKVIDRYAADHRDLLLGDQECLSALRRLLESFVRSGWDQAIDRVQSLSEFLY